MNWPKEDKRDRSLSRHKHSQEVAAGAFNRAFNAENRLQSVAVGSQTTSFYYDAEGNRTLTIYGTGSSQVKIYTPFPDFEESLPPSGSTTQRTGNSIAVHRV